MKPIFKILSLFITSGIKFIFGPTVAIASGFKAWESILITTAGGISGVLFFYFTSKWTLKKLFYFRNKRRLKKIKSGNWIPPKKFTFLNKLIVRVKNRFGLTGLAIITPPLLSIPLGTILAVRYYSKNHNPLKSLIYSVIIWSIALTYLSKLIEINIK
jgi:hypothetical protein